MNRLPLNARFASAQPTGLSYAKRSGCSREVRLDLVRSILIYVENAGSEVDADDMSTERWPIEAVAYHVRLMAHHGLLGRRDRLAEPGRHVRAGHHDGRVDIRG